MKDVGDLGATLVAVVQQKRFVKTYRRRAVESGATTSQSTGRDSTSVLPSIGVVSEKALQGQAMTQSIR